MQSYRNYSNYHELSSSQFKSDGGASESGDETDRQSPTMEDIVEDDILNMNWEQKESQNILNEQTTKETTHIIHFDSRDHPPHSTHGDTNIHRLMFKSPFYNVISFELKYACVPSESNCYNIHEYNNTLEWKERNSVSNVATSTFFIKIPPGKYSNTSLVATIQSMMNDKQYISSDTYSNGGQGNSSVFRVSLDENTNKITFRLQQNNSATFFTDSIMFPFATGQHTDTSIHEVLGYPKEDTPWSTSFYNTFSGTAVAGGTNKLITDVVTELQLTEDDEGSFISVVSSNLSSGIELDTSNIEVIDSGSTTTVLVSDELAVSGPSFFRIYKKEGRTHTSPEPLFLYKPMYFDINSPLSCPIRPTSTRQTGDEEHVARVFMDRTGNYMPNTEKRYFHAIPRLGFIDLYFTVRGNEKSIPSQAAMRNQPIVLQFEVTSIERTNANLTNYTIE